MSTVTYKHQPGIHKTRGAIPLAGTSHLYTVTKLLWPTEVEDYIKTLLIGKTLHICCGLSKLGDCRVDNNPDVNPDVLADAANLSEHFVDNSWDTVLCDPPYNGKMQWNHNMLSELSRIASQRIVFQHWFLACDKLGRYKKAHKFLLTDLYNWQPKAYFGRVNTIQVYDNFEDKE